jgi:hypothetical protein
MIVPSSEAALTHMSRGICKTRIREIERQEWVGCDLSVRSVSRTLREHSIEHCVRTWDVDIFTVETFGSVTWVPLRFGFVILIHRFILYSGSIVELNALKGLIHMSHVQGDCQAAGVHTPTCAPPIIRLP